MTTKHTLSEETIDAFRRLDKGFMKPEFFFGAVTFDSELGPMPSEDWLNNFDPCDDASRIEDEKECWACRLSAPGYLDCTDWVAFDTEGECVEYLVDTYGE